MVNILGFGEWEGVIFYGERSTISLAFLEIYEFGRRVIFGHTSNRLF